jgi:hypothetical protein
LLKVLDSSLRWNDDQVLDQPFPAIDSISLAFVFFVFFVVHSFDV